MSGKANTPVREPSNQESHLKDGFSIYIKISSKSTLYYIYDNLHSKLNKCILQNRLCTKEKEMKIATRFKHIHSSFGYQFVPGVPVYPCPDPTTLFVSATISTLGPELYRANRPLVTVQECLRTQNIKSVLDADYDPEYLSCFTMLGVQAPLTHFTVEHVIAWFDSFPGLRERTVLRTSSRLVEAPFTALLTHFKAVYDDRPSTYYQWQYGDRPLTGQGLTFSLRQLDGSLADVGNFIVLSEHGVPFAYEYGFGVETFSARLQGLSTPYATSAPITRLGIDVNAPAEKRAADALTVAWQLVRLGIKPGSGKVASVLRKALRHFAFTHLCKLGGTTASGTLLALQLSKSAQWWSIINEQLQDTEDRLRNYQHNSAHIARHCHGEHLEKKLKEYRHRYGIPEGL